MANPPRKSSRRDRAKSKRVRGAPPPTYASRKVCPRCGGTERYTNGHCATCARAKVQARLDAMGPDGRKAMYRARNLRTRFNITVEEFDAILAAQGGVCAGCKRRPDEMTAPFALDHDHSTRVVRGVLCFSCNSMLPTRRNIRELFHNLTTYLDDPPAVRVLGEERLANAVRRKRRRKRGTTS